MSVDRAGTATASSSRRATTLPDVDEVERQGSTGSINYSRPRPMSAQGQSPISPPKSAGRGGSWFTSPTGTLSDKPIARPATTSGPTKKKQTTNNVQSAPLARANEPSHTTEEPSSDPIMVYDPASRTFITKARPVEQERRPPSPSPAIQKPAGPVAKPGEYDPNTRKIVPELPPQQPSIVVTGGDNTTTRAKPRLAAVDTQLEPPPRNPARADANASPVSPRAAGVLQKQPSVVREDPEGEQEAETSGNVRPHKRQTNGFSKTTMRPASMAATPAGARTRSESLDVPRSGSDSSGRARGNSHSPSRSAHFSESPILEFTRHDPPERGISPAKSAMKHSPSSSVRGSSPMALGASPVRKAMSETSDTPSVESAVKKKKSVRVSFTDQPASIEFPVTPASQAASARKVSPLIDDDMEEIMKPRPDLPSFGSVRQNRMQQEIAEKVTERPPDRREVSSDQAIGGILAQSSAQGQSSNDPEPPEVTSRNGPSYSSDESEDETAPASELDAGSASAKAVYSQVVAPKSEAEAYPSKPEKEQAPDIQISLQPPTPGEEEKEFAEAARAESPPPRSSLERFAVPGGWTAEPDEEDVPVAAPASAAAVIAKNETDKTTSVPDTANAVPVAQPEYTTSHAPVEYQLSDIAESDSDDSAIFSDAEEDLSYMDGTGFASMDAIVESPAVQQKKETAPESPSARQAARRTSKEEARSGAKDWSQATSYWSQLSRQQREQIERSHLSSDDEYKPAGKSLAEKPRKKKSALKQPARVEPVASSDAPRQAPVQPVKSAMRKSMRGPAEPAPAPTTTNSVQMRSSLREGGGGGMRTSMRDRPQSEYMASKPAVTKQTPRPASSGSSMPTAAAGGAMSQPPQSPDVPSQDGPFPRLPSNQQQQQPSASVKLAKKMPPPPAPANDSDSESSFRKKRRPSQSNADASGRYSMKRSMRSGSIDSQQQRPTSPTPGPPPATKGRKAFSVRSLSPTGSFFGRKQLKESMRAVPEDTGAKTLRGPNSMRNTKSKPQAAPRQSSSTNNMASKFKSRFADSDDEDEREGQKSSFFRSKFADSDDDEPISRAVIPADLTPVRGIPKRRDQDDGDSTDLSDDSDEDPRKASRGRNKQAKPIVPDSADVEKAMAAARRNLGMTSGSAAPGTPPANEGGALSKGSLRKPEPERPQSPALESPKKRSFMGSFLRRSRTHSNASQQLPMASPPPPLPTQPPLASPRPGKLQRRTSTATQERDYFNNANPKTAQTGDDANWPLSPPGHLGADLRPNTSDGLSRHEQAVRLARTMRPDIGRSQSNTEAISNGPGHVGFAADTKEVNGNNAAYSSKTGKKKKFGMLRKAFGLND